MAEGTVAREQLLVAPCRSQRGANRMERGKVRKEGRILRDLTPELKFASPQAAPLPLISPEGGHGLGLAPKDHAWVLRLLSQVLVSSGFSGEDCLQFRRPTFDSWVRTIPWRRKWQPTPVFLPGKSHGQRSLAGYSPWGRKELDTTGQLTLSLHFLRSAEAMCSPTLLDFNSKHQAHDSS